MFDYRELADKYNLEVVAGNFFQVRIVEVKDANSYFLKLFKGPMEWVLDSKDDL